MGDVRVCPECNGVGRVTNQDGDPEVCPNCRGAGFVSDEIEQPVIREPEPDA
jgi:DnaJ-class molecular chaperone